MKNPQILERLIEGNRRYLTQTQPVGEVSPALRRHPCAIVICCSDSRVVPEHIFSAGLGELFVIRVAGNVLDRHQLGSIEYAAAHLHCRLILVLGHTGCGAIGAALEGGGEGMISYITDEILRALESTDAGIPINPGLARGTGSAGSAREGSACLRRQ